jgi:beta-aspartyl-peptidase (threonine type)
MTGKMRGRLGDSPLVGCGCYADNSTLGVSATGYGEQIISMALASRVSFLAEYEGLSAQEACNRALT